VNMGTVQDNSDVRVAEQQGSEGRKTILIVSPDPNFCLSLSMLFGDRYRVLTASSLSVLQEGMEARRIDLILVDEGPSRKMVERIDAFRHLNPTLPIIILYVYSPKDVDLDSDLRKTADSVFYKPFEIGTVSKRVDDLLSV
jgi:DNA-binding response OmpR family regulator